MSEGVKAYERTLPKPRSGCRMQLTRGQAKGKCLGGESGDSPMRMELTAARSGAGYEEQSLQ